MQDWMIDIAAWRAAIGSWYIAGLAHISSCFYNYQCPFARNLEYRLSFVCILILLLLGGIESNPGPVLRSHEKKEVNSHQGKTYIINLTECIVIQCDRLYDYVEFRTTNIQADD